MCKPEPQQACVCHPHLLAAGTVVPWPCRIPVSRSAGCRESRWDRERSPSCTAPLTRQVSVKQGFKCLVDDHPTLAIAGNRKGLEVQPCLFTPTPQTKPDPPPAAPRCPPARGAAPSSGLELLVYPFAAVIQLRAASVSQGFCRTSRLPTSLETEWQLGCQSGLRSGAAVRATLVSWRWLRTFGPSRVSTVRGSFCRRRGDGPAQLALGG